mgnify:CR=1 FL=1
MVGDCEDTGFGIIVLALDRFHLLDRTQTPSRLVTGLYTGTIPFLQYAASNQTIRKQPNGCDPKYFHSSVPCTVVRMLLRTYVHIKFSLPF